MRKFFFGLWALIVSALFLIPPASAQTKFAEEMKPYVGHILSPDEIRKVLVGNTVISGVESQERRGFVYSAFWYFKDDKVRQVSYSISRTGRESPWSATADKGYCHNIAGGDRKGRPYCRNLRISIEGDEVKITFVGSSSRDRTFTLKKGKYSGQSWN